MRADGNINQSQTIRLIGDIFENRKIYCKIFNLRYFKYIIDKFSRSVFPYKASVFNIIGFTGRVFSFARLASFIDFFDSVGVFMVVSFFSTDNQNNRVSFRAEAVYDKETLVFQDKSVKDTYIRVSVSGNKLCFERKGAVCMAMELEAGARRTGWYKNAMGLEFSFVSDCRVLKITEKKLEMEYDMILDGEVLSKHKIWIIIR